MPVLGPVAAPRRGIVAARVASRVPSQVGCGSRCSRAGAAWAHATPQRTTYLTDPAPRRRATPECAAQPGESTRHASRCHTSTPGTTCGERARAAEAPVWCQDAAAEEGRRRRRGKVQAASNVGTTSARAAGAARGRWPWYRLPCHRPTRCLWRWRPRRAVQRVCEPLCAREPSRLVRRGQPGHPARRRLHRGRAGPR